MTLAKERFSFGEWLPIWVRQEHMARYQFAQRFVRGKLVVDCACGDGVGSAMFAEAGAEAVLAFDRTQDRITTSWGEKRRDRLCFGVADAVHIPLRDAVADVVVSLETIEHLEKDVEFLGEVARVLKPDGTFLCSTPNRRISNPGRTISDKPWNRFHVRECDETEFRALCARHFATIDLYGQNPKVRLISKLLTVLAGILPFHGAVRINQAFKLFRFFYHDLAHHRVVPVDDPKRFEYLVAVCRFRA